MHSALDLTDTLLDGRYRLTRLMGEGGMGQVYEGIHEQLARKIAVKVLLPRFAYDLKFRERFLREARATSKIRHPNIVQLVDFGATPNGSVYFAMEFLEGRDLSSLLRDEGHLSWPRARHLLLQMISALGAAHQHEIVHRDVKPGNFFIIDAFGHKEFIKVLDFGIAKITSTPSENRTLAQNLTGTGEIFGTAKYMAPEQAFGESNDLRVDIYSLGVVAYQMLTGDVPFTGDSAFEIITRHVNEPPRAPRMLVPSIPMAVEQVILRAIAKRPEDRFSSMEQMRMALADIPSDGDTAHGIPSFPGDSASARPAPGRPVVRLTERPLGAHSKSSKDPLARDDSDSLRLEAFAPIHLRGTPLNVPLAANPFKSVGPLEPEESEPGVNPFKSVSPQGSEVEPTPARTQPEPTAPAPQPDAFGALGVQETSPAFSAAEMAALETLRALSTPRPRAPPSTARTAPAADAAAPSPAFTSAQQQTQTPATLPFVKSPDTDGSTPEVVLGMPLAHAPTAPSPPATPAPGVTAPGVTAPPFPPIGSTEPPGAAH
ncbi:MAG: protein kinase, partial [Myxococcales bacterium]|nr:protein kinase [Myxococcales bacterium]